MNERIRELVEQCTKKLTTYSYSRGNITETYFDKEKFAELIVRECASVADKWNMYGDPETSAAPAVKEHFGVEE